MVLSLVWFKPKLQGANPQKPKEVTCRNIN